MTTVHVVLPGDIDDPLHRSGGNVYDRELCTGLAALGWTVREHAVRGSWPHPDVGARSHLERTLARVPDDAVLLVDGLVAVAGALETAMASERLRPVVLAHMVSAEVDAPEERMAVLAARAVITTSTWTRDQLVARHAVPRARVHVAEPGVHPADPTLPGPTGERLLCVGPVSYGKGHDVLLVALSSLTDLPWHCTCVGALDREPGLTRMLRERSEGADLAGRLTFAGPVAEVDYGEADLLVHPTRDDAYAMVVTEALAHAVPVLTCDVGGVPSALGRAAESTQLVPAGDADALASALRGWLEDAGTRRRWREAARLRRLELAPWDRTVARVDRVLREVARDPRPA